MPETFVCPRCFRTVASRSSGRFCPHCGLEGAREAAGDADPILLNIGAREYLVEDRLAVGSICTIYRCRLPADPQPLRGIFKIARESRVNPLLANEAAILQSLSRADSAGRFAPFLPQVQASAHLDDAGGARAGNVLGYHAEVGDPADLFSLDDVKNAYSPGLDERNMAWIWRRLLNILGFVHAQGIVHGAVLPMHILVEPRDHKLVLIDWCCATAGGHRAMPIIAAGFQAWYKTEAEVARPPIPALDLAFAARSMIDLIGGDGRTGELPQAIDPAIRRHLQRCISPSAQARLEAWRLLEEFDRLLEALWGPRSFTTFRMPPPAARQRP